MKSFIILWASLAVAASVSAAPIPVCASGSYATYEALPNGCVVNNLLFTNFSDIESGALPALALTAANITVTPDFFTLDEGLQFTGSWSVSNSGAQGSTLTYVVQTFNSADTLSAINLSFNGIAGGGGTSSQTETYCLGSALGTGLCPTTNQVISVSNGNTGPFTQIFPATSVISVTNQISVAGNGTGTASISQVSDNYAQGAAVPEPVSFLLLGGGLVGIGLLRMRKVKTSASGRTETPADLPR